jgi:hypothetical protein
MFMDLLDRGFKIRPAIRCQAEHIESVYRFRGCGEGHVWQPDLFGLGTWLVRQVWCFTLVCRVPWVQTGQYHIKCHPTLLDHIFIYDIDQCRRKKNTPEATFHSLYKTCESVDKFTITEGESYG